MSFVLEIIPCESRFCPTRKHVGGNKLKLIHLSRISLFVDVIVCLHQYKVRAEVVHMEI